MSVTHLNGFGTNDYTVDQEVNIGKENSKENHLNVNEPRSNTTSHLGKNDLRNINKIAAKKLSKTKKFSKQQLHKNDAKSLKANKTTKRKDKFSKKSAQSKRSKHYNPKNNSHKHNKM